MSTRDLKTAFDTQTTDIPLPPLLRLEFDVLLRKITNIVTQQNLEENQRVLTSRQAHDIVETVRDIWDEALERVKLNSMDTVKKYGLARALNDQFNEFEKGAWQVMPEPATSQMSFILQ